MAVVTAPKINVRQLVVLVVGTLAAVALVAMPRLHTPPRLVSVQTQPGGVIERTYQSRPSPWQPSLFGLVVLVTGATFFALRSRQAPTGR